MPGTAEMTRRGVLAGLGCSAAAPLVTPVTWAAAPGEARLVVILLRGAMDGLDVLRPVGDPALAGLRPSLHQAGAGAEVAGFYRLHPELRGLEPLWRAGELGFAQAVATPYRDKRSHFDGQDLLETGVGAAGEARNGWLNRALGLMPGAQAQTAFAVGRQGMLLLGGAAPVSTWSPDSDLDLGPQGELLLRAIYARDPLFTAAVEQAIALSRESEGRRMGPGRAGQAVVLAEFAARKLRNEARIAAFSITGWDTHASQTQGMKWALGGLSDAILALKAGLGPVWGRTAVLCMTEFGRTARENGARGTDHGTGGLAVYAGGALRGGQVLFDWPGLGEGQLYQGRDLRPVADVRALAGWTLAALFGIGRDAVEKTIFPGLDLGRDPGLVA